MAISSQGVIQSISCLVLGYRVFGVVSYYIIHTLQTEDRQTDATL